MSISSSTNDRHMNSRLRDATTPFSPLMPRKNYDQWSALTQRKQSRTVSTRIRNSLRLFSTSSDNSGVVVSGENSNNNDNSSVPKDFASMGIQSPVLLHRIKTLLQLKCPTAVQAAAFTALSISTDDNNNNRQLSDAMIGSETGSGKTLSYLLPLMNDILQRKAAAAAAHQSNKDDKNDLIGYDYARALILVPNKELVQQVVRMAMDLAGGPASVVYGGNTMLDTLPWSSSNNSKAAKNSETPDSEMVRIAILPGGLRETLDFAPFRRPGSAGDSSSTSLVMPPVDILISTPAAVAPLGVSPKNIALFADIQTVVMDEADLLLDGGYIRPLNDVLLGFRRADRLESSSGFTSQPSSWHRRTQHVFVAATLPNSGLRSVDAYLTKKFPNIQRIAMDNMHMARHSGLMPGQATLWIEEESKKQRMLELVRLLTTGELKHQKVMVFLNSGEDAEASCQALERAGVPCLPFHAKILLEERTATLDRFRKYSAVAANENLPTHNASADGVGNMTSTISVLVCTDLASRGLDIPDVTAVVQLQFAGNVVAHLHRMGRCGRQQQTGRGVVFYGVKERALVATLQEAESYQQQSSQNNDTTSSDLPHGLSLTGDVTDIPLFDLDKEDVINLNDSSKSAIESRHEAGKITASFSRKRGFTKKIKKEVRRRIDERENSNYDA